MSIAEQKGSIRRRNSPQLSGACGLARVLPAHSFKDFATHNRSGSVGTGMETRLGFIHCISNCQWGVHVHTYGL